MFSPDIDIDIDMDMDMDIDIDRPQARKFDPVPGLSQLECPKAAY